jgi:hypothetical protein
MKRVTLHHQNPPRGKAIKIDKEWEGVINGEKKIKIVVRLIRRAIVEAGIRMKVVEKKQA